jgi:hypothetical protein
MSVDEYPGPAQGAIEYELVTFLSGHDNDGTQFVLENSPELDEAWLSLYPSKLIEDHLRQLISR